MSARETLYRLRHPRLDLWMCRNADGGWYWTDDIAFATPLTADGCYFWQTVIYKRTTLVARQEEMVSV